MSNSVKSVSVGAAARGIDLLEVDSSQWQRIIDDPIHRATVTAACRGSLTTRVSFDDVFSREIRVNGVLCEWAGISAPSGKKIELALRKAETEWGGLTLHDRVIPEGLNILQLFQAMYAFNDYCSRENKIGIKLTHERYQEWWRTNEKVQHLPTEFGILRQDLGAVMQPTDLAGRPFFLDVDEQEAWVREQGGDGVTSVEETLYLFFRSAYEFGRPLWGGGWVRCRNKFGSGNRLFAYWVAGSGLDVNHLNTYVRYWTRGCLARKFLGA